ncbi:MAG: substrate-binding domain-containing protein [Phycisphaerales bacterium]|nr:substrate-binding domain-containing protein [Phycisphaerales bacterium]
MKGLRLARSARVCPAGGGRWPRYLALLALLCGAVLSCDRAPSGGELVLYTSIDEPVARPIIQEYERNSGVKVVLVTDTEASKSIGLAERLRAEKDRPRCDVWWGNEPFHTIRLAEEGLFAPFDSPSAGDVLPLYRDRHQRWVGNGLRARVIICSSHDSNSLNRLDELPAFAGQSAMARPTAGTTAGHVAALYEVWGTERADAFFRALREGGITLLGGNGPVAEAVAGGRFRFGLTDNDDVAHVARHNNSITFRIPPVDSTIDGTLMIPTTVALVAKPTENPHARSLVDYLLSSDVERKLIEARFAGWSVRGGDTQPPAMQIDYVQVARRLPEAIRRATAILDARAP